MSTRAENTRLMTEEELERKALAKDNFIKKFIFIASAEKSRAIYSSSIVFLVIFVYSMMKSMKNAMVAGQIDPSAISYIKLIFVLPINILLIAFTQKMVSMNTVSRSFTFMLIGFAASFFLYGAICFYCYNFTFRLFEHLAEDMFNDGKLAYKGFGVVYYVIFKTFTSIRVVMYYLLSELYGSIITSYLFWSFANEFLTRKQSLRFTPLLLMCGNIGLLLSGLFIGKLTTLLEGARYEWNQYFTIGFPVFCGILCISICILKSFFERNILSKEIIQPTSSDTPRTNVRRKVSFLEAFKITFASKLVLGISVCVFAYNFSLNIIEGFCIRTYKVRAENSTHGMKPESHLRMLESLGQVITAIIVIGFTFMPSGKLIQRGYFFYYAISAFIVSLLGTLAVISIGHFNIRALSEGNHPDGIFGSFENRLFFEEMIVFIFILLFRIVKYAAFDVTKEAISMKIHPMYRAVFKGVYDGHFGKLSKAFGALYSIGANFYYDNWDIRMASVPSFFILMSLNFTWMYMVIYLSSKFNSSLSENKDIELDWAQGKPIF